MHYQSKMNNAVRFICIFVAFAFIIISAAVYHTNITRLVVFFLFMLISVQLPGMLITSSLKIRTGHISSDLIVSFFSGWALCIAGYFFCTSVNNNIVLYLLGPLLSCIYCYKLYKESGFKAISDFSISKIPASFFVFIILLFSFTMLTTQFQYMSPEYSRYIYSTMDKTYQMGLIGSLARDYPLVNPWVSGKIVYYHIFTQILLAIPVRLFGFTPDFLVMSCCPYLTTYAWGLSIYSMFRYFCKYKRRAGLYSLSVMLSFMLAARELTASYLFRIMLNNENYGGTGVACSIAWIILLSFYFDNKDSSYALRIGRLLLFTAMTMLLTGIKAPVGLVMTGGLIGTFLLGLVLKKINIKEHLPAVFCSFLGFYIVYKLIIGTDGSAGVGGESIFGVGDITGLCFWKGPLTEILKNAGIPYMLRLLIILILFCVSFFTIYLLPFAIGYIREFILTVRGHKEYDIARITVYASAFVGFFLVMLLRYSGHSQIYFGTVTAVFSALISFWFFEDVSSGSYSWTRILKKVAIVAFFTTLLFTSVSLAAGYKSFLPDVIKHADPQSKYNKYRMISSDEYEAMLWLKNNTDDNALISTQMYASVSFDDYTIDDRWESCHFLYAVFSDRNYYLEGTGYTFNYDELDILEEMIKENKKLYDPSNENRGDDAKRLGVDYVVVTTRLHPTDDLSCSEYSKVYSNMDIEIYKIN